MSNARIRLTIARYTVELELDQGPLATALERAFSSFFTDAAVDTRILVRLTRGRTSSQAHQLPEVLRAADGSLRVSAPTFEATVSQDRKTAEITQTEERFPTESLLKVLLADALLARGGLLVHGVGIAVHERAAVFVGDSGAGKSTLGELSARAGLVRLADELVAVWSEGGKTWAAGTPWNVGQPRSAVVGMAGTLAFGEEERIEALEGAELLRVLLPNTLMPDPTAEGLARIFRVAADLLSGLPAIRLHFAPTPGVGQFLAERLKPTRRSVSTDDELIVLAGPTGSGKTALAVELAAKLNAEIISADSQQIYRHFDIGTAKPTADELARVPHHLISVVEPQEEFSAARYQALADAVISDIRRRGKRVIIAGGTGLYLRALLHGIMAAPRRDAKLRERLNREAAEHGPLALHRRLTEVDPTTAALIPANDLVRVIRALEIFELTGSTASERRAQHAFGEERYPFRLFVLNPPREELYRRIDARTEAMFRAGLLDEVRQLIALGHRASAPMRSVGYVQALGVVDGVMTIEEAIQDTAQKTRHYAKRQLTWFRKEEGALFVAPPYTLAL